MYAPRRRAKAKAIAIRYDLRKDLFLIMSGLTLLLAAVLLRA
jgi:hypothetical protein